MSRISHPTNFQPIDEAYQLGANAMKEAIMKALKPYKKNKDYTDIQSTIAKLDVGK